jgi:hypothetical protein
VNDHGTWRFLPTTKGCGWPAPSARAHIMALPNEANTMLRPSGVQMGPSLARPGCDCLKISPTGSVRRPFNDRLPPCQ